MDFAAHELRDRLRVCIERVLYSTDPSCPRLRDIRAKIGRLPYCTACFELMDIHPRELLRFEDRVQSLEQMAGISPARSYLEH